MIIGVDFDNTIISYGELFYQEALRRGLIKKGFSKNKKLIRDRIRKTYSDIEWQKLQGKVYGSGIQEAELIEGTGNFIVSCKRSGISLYIISHKTQYANFDDTKINLRKAALNWMSRNDFFNSNGMGFDRKHIYFEPTKNEKIERIKQLKCTHFIDDLEETFLEKPFPENVKKILYDPDGLFTDCLGVKIVRSWNEITEYFFSANN